MVLARGTRVCDSKCAREVAGDDLTFKKRGHLEPSALAQVLVYSTCICVRYLYDRRSSNKRKRADIFLDDLGIELIFRPKILGPLLPRLK